LKVRFLGSMCRYQEDLVYGFSVLKGYAETEVPKNPAVRRRVLRR